MDNSIIKINNDTVLSAGEIKEIRPLSDEDRAKLQEDLPRANAQRFHTRIETESRTRYAEQTIEDLGIALVEYAPGRFIPAANIEAATALTEEEQTRLAEDERYTLTQDFASRVELKGGKIKLSTLKPDRLMNNRNMALSLRSTIKRG